MDLFSRWLEKKSDASWKQLLSAIDEIHSLHYQEGMGHIYIAG